MGILMLIVLGEVVNYCLLISSNPTYMEVFNVDF